ncbi:MAG TPA: fibronectin type III domain-containing protein, partial [Candidatus Binatia bacterium]
MKLRRMPTHLTIAIVWILIPLLWILARTTISWGGTALGDLAASMKPGQWAKLNATGQMPGGNSIFNISGGNILEYGGKGVWDSQNKQFRYAGTSHHGRFDYKLVYFDEATNSWNIWNDNCGQTGDPGSLGGTICDHWRNSAHSYDHQTGDGKSNYYVRQGAIVSKYNILTNPWTTFPSVSNLMQTYIANSLIFFPDYGSDGSLIMWDGDWGVVRWDFANPAWTKIAQGSGGGYEPLPTLTYAGSIHGVTAYSAAKKVIVRCGGNPGNAGTGGNICYKLDVSGKFTKLTDFPGNSGIGTFGNWQGHLIPDPATGNFLVITGTGQFWQLNPDGAGTWTQLTTNLPITTGLEGDTDYMTYAPIPEYGVIFIATRTQTWLYKHGSASTPPPPSDTSAPSVPSGLVASALSSSQINLSWNAATDNVGVAGYRIYRNGVQIGTTSATVYQDTGLAPATAYAYRIAAYDASANVSGQSTQTSASTLSANIVSSDFQTRCSAAGVVRCIGFDQASDIVGRYGNNTGIIPNNASPVIDTTMAASGAGSLKFTIPTNSSAPAGGSFFANLSTDLNTRFGAGQSFFVQWRQRFNTDFLNTVFHGQFQGDGTLTFGATSGNGVTATLKGSSYTFTGFTGRAISDSNLVAYCTITSVIDATHALCNWTGISPSTSFSSGNWLHTFGGANGWKQLIIGAGDVPGAGCSSSSTSNCMSSCTTNDIVVQNTNQATYPQMYAMCGRYISFVTDFNNPNFGGSADFKEQTARTHPFCTYLQRNAGTPFANRNCFRYVADEWMTFQVGVTLGALGTGSESGFSGYPAYVDSQIRMWVARDGQASELVMDTIFDINAETQLNSGGAGVTGSEKIGKVWLLPYHTGKAGAQAHPTGYVWYDELIISRQRIADPSSATT